MISNIATALVKLCYGFLLNYTLAAAGRYCLPLKNFIRCDIWAPMCSVVEAHGGGDGGLFGPIRGLYTR